MSTLNTILIFAYLAHFILAAEYPCNVSLSVDISDGERNESDESIIKDGVTYPKGQYFEYERKTMGCFCNLKPCIRKCCPLGKYLTSGKECVETQEDFTQDLVTLQLISANINTYSIINVPCNTKSVILDPQDKDEKLKIDDNGLLVWGDPETQEDATEESYCVDYIENTGGIKILVCDFADGIEGESNTHNSIGNVL